MSVLVSKSLTAEDKRHVSVLLDAKIAELISDGKTDAREIAEIAVKEATKKHRQSQSVASRTALRREKLSRVASASMSPIRTR